MFTIEEKEMLTDLLMCEIFFCKFCTSQLESENDKDIVQFAELLKRQENKISKLQSILKKIHE